MKDERLEEIKAILRHFAVKPRHYEKYGRAYKIYSDKGVFALKEIPSRQGIDFIRHLQFLYQRGYNRIVPVYPTFDGRYGVLYNHRLYYLMPWLSNEMKEERDRHFQQMFRELARLHTLSVQEVAVDKEDMTRHFEKTTFQWEKDEEFLEGFIEQCESKLYMSPFELLFCMYYIEITRAQSYAKKKLETWYSQAGEQKKARIVLSHGKISPEHFVFDQKGYGYFINFENSRPGTPLMDLLPFLSRTLHTYPKQCDQCVDWLYTYFKYFPLTEEEMLLFQSYFSQPGPIIRTVEAYFKANEPDERKFVQELQEKFWLLKNTEYVMMRIEEIEQKKKEQQALEEQIAKENQS